MECRQALLDVSFAKSSLLQELHLCLQRYALLKCLFCRGTGTGQALPTTHLERRPCSTLPLKFFAQLLHAA